MHPGKYRIMTWQPWHDGPWTSDTGRRFRDDGFDGLVMSTDADSTPRDLDFLGDLEGLRYLSFTGRVRNDSAAFHVPTLEELALVTGSSRRIPDEPAPGLTALCLTDRPGIEVAKHWPRLQYLRVGRWKGTDLGLIAGATFLKEIYLEARRQTGSLDGVDSCPNLQSLLLVDYAVTGVAPLAGLTRLAELKLLAARPTPEHGDLDLASIRSPRLAEFWISHASGLSNVDALGRLSNLRELRLIDCALSEEARAALTALPTRVSVDLDSPRGQ